MVWLLGVVGVVVVMLIAANVALKYYVEYKWPPIGEFANIDGTQMHYVDVPAGEDDDLPPIVFIHGASSNLLDQMWPLRPLFEGRGRLLFVDRPGLGYSTRIDEKFHDPVHQAQTIAGLMDHLGIEKAIICGHSLGSAITVALGVHHPQRTSGLLFLAPATHPWPGGLDWYYELAQKPVIGTFFCYLLAGPIGWFKYPSSIRSVFSPDPMPDHYPGVSGTRTGLRGEQFFHNTRDVINLHDNVSRMSERYHEIKVPTVIITGDSDTVVIPEIHSKGLARDISGSQLIVKPKMGHKPDYLALDDIVTSIEKIADEIKSGKKSARKPRRKSA